VCHDKVMLQMIGKTQDLTPPTLQLSMDLVSGKETVVGDGLLGLGGGWRQERAAQQGEEECGE